MQKSFSLPAQPESLHLIREEIDQVAEKIHLERKKGYRLKLALDEIATNIINYGYAASEKQGEKPPEIHITIQINEQYLSVTLTDQAMAFNPLAKELPGEAELSKPPEQRKIGGLGIMLARNSVDDFKYEFRDGKNINTLSIELHDNRGR